jgi:hypothetical protein
MVAATLIASVTGTAIASPTFVVVGVAAECNQFVVPSLFAQ